MDLREERLKYGKVKEWRWREENKNKKNTRGLNGWKGLVERKEKGKKTTKKGEKTKKNTRGLIEWKGLVEGKEKEKKVRKIHEELLGESLREEALGEIRQKKIKENIKGERIR